MPPKRVPRKRKEPDPDDPFTDAPPAKKKQPKTSTGPLKAQPTKKPSSGFTTPPPTKLGSTYSSSGYSTPTGKAFHPTSFKKSQTGGLMRSFSTTSSVRSTPGPKTHQPRSPAEEIIIHCRLNHIPVFRPGDLEYERSVASTNLLHRYTRPDCVVQPASAHDVAEVVKQCRQHKMGLKVKSGGHSYAGHSMAEEGVLLDMHRLKGTTLDMQNKVIYVDGGALWVDVYKRLINGRHNGWAANGGRCPTVGVSGFLLGGGMGPFSRTLGMGCDSVISVTLVTADGHIVTVGKDDDPNSPEGELFWALRGGGGGNFGVVVQWKLRVEQLQDLRFGGCGMVTAGRYGWYYRGDDYNALSQSDKDKADDLFKNTMSQFYRFVWPDRITIDSTWVRQTTNPKGTMIRFISYCDGDRDYFERYINRGINQKDVREQLKRRCMPEKSTRFLHETLTAQWNEETIRTIPNSTQFRLYAGFALDNNESMDHVNEIVVILHKELDDFAEKFKNDNAECSVSLIHGGAAASKVNRGETAYRWRKSTYQCYIMLTFFDKWLERDMREYLSGFKVLLRQHAVAQKAVFINFPDSEMPPEAYERAYYGYNAERLRRIKGEWDPEDFFQWGQSVQLPGKKIMTDRKMRRATADANTAVEALTEAEDTEEDWEDWEIIRTEDLASVRWEKQFDVPKTEWLNNAGDIYPPVEPGTHATDIVELYDPDENLRCD
ncbi:hypothetical protein PGQ11_002552 [Apiospora arundinis]|uniref:FAD-binding PCMH-type domain-containing protein n=1 Tax=Apiospora arundinis TaxID=335852 RepID=A0ABR2JIG5_9PEZI